MLLPLEGEAAISSGARRPSSASTARPGSTSTSSSTARATGSRTASAGSTSASTASTTRWPCAITSRSRARPSSSPGGRFHHAWAVKSEHELQSVKDSVRINTEGFRIFLEHFAPGKSEQEILAHCEPLLRRGGCGAPDHGHAGDGPDGAALPEFSIAGDYRIGATEMALPRSRPPAWRQLGRGLTCDLPRRAERPHATRCSTPTTVLRPRARCAARRARRRTRCTVRSRRASWSVASSSATSPGHSIGMTMIEFPRIGEGDETVLRGEHGLLDAPPRDLPDDGKACLYMQDMLVTAARFSCRPAAEIFDGSEARTVSHLREARLARSAALGLRALPSHRRAALPGRRPPPNGRTATSSSSSPSTSPRARRSSAGRGRKAARLVTGAASRGAIRPLRRAERLLEDRYGGPRHARAHSPWEYHEVRRCSAMAAASTRPAFTAAPGGNRSARVPRARSNGRASHSSTSIRRAGSTRTSTSSPNS